jgi:hypothetical protein
MNKNKNERIVSVGAHIVETFANAMHLGTVIAAALIIKLDEGKFISCSRQKSGFLMFTIRHNAGRAVMLNWAKTDQPIIWYV